MNFGELSLVWLGTLLRLTESILYHYPFLQLESMFVIDFRLWNESFGRFDKFQIYPLRGKPNILVYAINKFKKPFFIKGVCYSRGPPNVTMNYEKWI